MVTASGVVVCRLCNCTLNFSPEDIQEREVKGWGGSGVAGYGFEHVDKTERFIHCPACEGDHILGFRYREIPDEPKPDPISVPTSEEMKLPLTPNSDFKLSSLLVP